ncbi:unnamed protein product [Notodromas monacha]|uniref:ubiquitinyl hydrolase 1 n=1 Tax=Notodromas monacha TaxID=399045 RepID=A0A7R9BP78_9CRUS|nr:unnamed protein product [Notodromas monacha]CAG0918046.1 unnamed protein product [Notodromas monacha]
MGGKESKSCPVSYEEALNRASEAEVRRLRDAFRRCVSGNGNLNLSSFQADVLGGSVPRPLAEQQVFLNICGGKGMSFKDLLCLLVVITSGNRMERAQLLFNLYSNENGVVPYETLYRHALDEDREYLSRMRNASPLSFPEFYRLLLARPDVTVMTRWLLSSAQLTLSDDHETPTFYQTLAGVTHYGDFSGVLVEEREIMNLEKKYWSFNGRLDEETFGRLISPPLPDDLKSLLFRAFDENRDDHIDFKELACGVSAACAGPIAERHKCTIPRETHLPTVCFKMFDMNGDGVLDLEELRCMARGLLQIRVEVRRGDFASSFTLQDCVIKDCRSCPRSSFSRLRNFPQLFAGDVDDIVEVVLESRHDKETSVSLQDYLVWAISTPLTVNFLSLLREICIVVLGLPPSDRQEEGRVVSRWISREGRRGLRAGTFWYLIDAKWFKDWLEYVNSAVVSSGGNQGSDALTAPATSGTSVSLSSTNSSPAGSLYGSLKRGTVGKRLTSSTLASDSDSGVIMTSCQVFNADELSPVNSLSVLSPSCFPRNNPSRSPSPAPSPKMCRRTPPSSPSSVAPPSRPPPIENSGLLAANTAKTVAITGEGGRLRRVPPLERTRDYELIPDAIWKAFSLWYGGGPALPRQVIYKSPASDDLELELHPIFFKLWRHQAVKKPVGNGVASPYAYGDAAQSSLFSTYGLMAGYSPAAMGSGGLNYFPALNSIPRRYLAYVAAFSRSATWQQVMTYLCNRLRLQPEDVRLWLFKDENNLTLIEDESCLLEQANLLEEESILVEVRDKDQTWPEEMSLLAKNPEVKIRSPQPLAAGATGLNNLGNTCFMNAALQCVSNTPPLTKYFLQDMHLYELNRTNPLGMKGHVAKRYGDLIKEIWNGSSKTLAPIKLKTTIGRYAPRFNCFQQQDSQELLAFLLDGLHEDLNRVHVKPYATLKDSDGRPDVEVAQEAWENHILRNKSIIVDLFHGQLKSKVTCKVCGHDSVRFDPFTYLTLPLPMENLLRVEIIRTRHVVFLVIFCEGKTPVKFGVRVEYGSTFASVKKALEEISGVSGDRMLFVQLSGPVIKEVIDDDAKVRDWSSILNSGTLFAYELPESRSSEVFPRSAAPPLRTNGHIPNDSVSKHLVRRNEGSALNLPEIRGPGIAVAFHRKTLRQDVYFLSVHKTKASLFGVPLVIPFPKGITNLELYEAVWVRVSRLVSPAPVVDSSCANHAQDCVHDDSLGYEFPFSLKAVNPDGSACAWCPWYEFCKGCSIPPNEAAFINPSPASVSNPKGFLYFAVDWDTTAIHLRYQAALERAFDTDDSVARTENEQNEPISLDRCLEAFTKEEELGENEKYFCTFCKVHQLAKIKLEIWRLPPVLIIHLKRFQFVGNQWMKSHKLVRFPFRDFDPHKFLASVPRTTIDRQKVARDVEGVEGSIEDSTGNSSYSEHDLVNDLVDLRRTITMNGDALNGSVSEKSNRQRLDSVTKCALNSAAPQDFHQHKLRNGADPFDLAYDLYAVIKHSGIMGGGHYTSYAMNGATRNWYFYNDSSCKEVSESQIDCDLAYILFYVRRDLDEAQYLPHVPSNAKLPDLSELEDELETDYRKYCSIV